MRFTGGLIVATAVIFTGCPNSGIPYGWQLPQAPPPLVWIDELFSEENIGNGITQTVFRTNDTKYRTREGTTMWTVWDEGSGDFESRTVGMTKSSGYSGGGYGMVFCHGEYEIDGDFIHAMLVIMINNDGQYIVGKVTGGVFTDFGWWKTTPHITKSAGYFNELKVDYIQETGKYRLEINGYEIEHFSDDNFPALRSGRNGYIAVITPFDNFPWSGVDIYFREEK